MNTYPFPLGALRLSLCVFLLPIALFAADAVVVNADGTAQFNYTVAGPNLLGTGKAPTAITTTTNLSAAVPGTLYTISGTTAAFTITLPPAGIGAGTILAFSVAPWASANKQYRLVPVSGQTLDGRSNGLVLIHTNYLEIMSVGGRWVSRVKKVDTDWVGTTDGITPLKITFAGTTPPTKPTSAPPAVDTINWKRSGDTMLIRGRYKHHTTRAGAQGTGSYRIQLPMGVYADPHKTAADTYSGYHACDLGDFAGNDDQFSMSYIGQMGLYDNSSLFAQVVGVGYDDETGSPVVARSVWGKVFRMNSWYVEFSFNATVPIAEW